MLLDRYLPQYDVTEAHAVVVDADTDLTWQAARRSDLSRSAVTQALLEMRSLPNRLQRVLTRRPSAWIFHGGDRVGAGIVVPVF
jgi:hypothetical protein